MPQRKGGCQEINASDKTDCHFLSGETASPITIIEMTVFKQKPLQTSPELDIYKIACGARRFKPFSQRTIPIRKHKEGDLDGCQNRGGDLG
jgi:hypothetical protein